MSQKRIKDLQVATTATPSDVLALDGNAGTRQMALAIFVQIVGEYLLSTGLSSLTMDWANVFNKPPTYPPSGHSHPIADVTGLQPSLDLKAPLASPALTGTPTAPTATAGDDSARIATTAFIKAAIVSLVNSAPTSLDTLGEIAAAINNDPAFATTIAAALATKLSKASNLSDLTDAPTARANLGLGAVSTLALIANANMTTMPPVTVKANVTGGTAAAVDVAISALLDAILGTAQGNIAYRGASGWVGLAPGTSGNVLATGGTAANPSWVPPGAPSPGSVTNTILANVLTRTSKGRLTASTGPPEDLTSLQQRYVAQISAWGFTVAVNTPAANQSTITLTHADGTAVSAANPLTIWFRSATAGSAVMVPRDITAPPTFVTTAGATHGFVSGQAWKFWLVGFDDAGTFRLGVITPRSGMNVRGLKAHGIASSTAGSGNLAQIFYTGTAVTSKSYTVLGSLEFNLATAGNWASAPTAADVWMPGMNLPGSVAAKYSDRFTAQTALATNTVGNTNAVPTTAEGTQILSASFTLQSAANLLTYSVDGVFTTSGAVAWVSFASFLDGSANSIGGNIAVTSNASYPLPLLMNNTVAPGSLAARTLTIRAGAAGVSNNLNTNGGGTSGTTLETEEIVT